MGGGGTPRQKMIGMMYLVLTALLAMNVSKSVLDAFVVVNEGLEETNKNFGMKNEKTYQDFKGAMDKDPVKTKPYFDLAMKAQKISKELNEYIEELKKELVKETEKIEDKKIIDTLTLKYVNSKDNYDIPTHVLIGDEPASPKKGKFTGVELQEKINKARHEFVELFNNPPGDKKLFLPNTKKEMDQKIGMHTKDFGVVNGTKETWVTGNFHHLPLAAVITNLSKMQADVKNAEADVINELMKSISGQDFKFDALEAKVIAPTSYVLLGQEYTADVFVAAFSTSQNPIVLLGSDSSRKDLIEAGKSSIPVENGMGKYKISPSSEGLQKWGGVIVVKSPDGTPKKYPFQAEFMAAKPSLTVSAEKMNVLYTGVDNPISVSVPGVPAENLIVSITQGTIPGAKGKYTARVTTPGTKVKVNVSAKFGSETKNMGFFEFRVKKVPDPVATIANLKGGAIAKGTLSVQYGIIPVLENFDFDLRFNCVGYEYTFVPKGGDPSTGKGDGPLTPELKSKISNCRPGSKIFFENIKVKGPDGQIRTLGGSLSFVLT